MQKLIWLNLCWAAKSFVYSEYEKMTEGYFSVQGHIQGYFPEHGPKTATSMLVTDVGDETHWWQFGDVGDGFFTISATNDFTKILTLSPTFENFYQL